MRSFMRGVGGAILLLLAIGCGGGDDEGGAPPIVSEIACVAAGNPAADRISIDCEAPVQDTLLIEVGIGGPTTSGDIYGIKFDLVFDPLVISFSPPAAEGTFLGRDGSGTIFQAALSPGDPGRLVVAITRQGAVGGVAGTGSTETVFAAAFLGVAQGSTDLAFDNVEVIDSALQPIPSIDFGAPASITYD